MNHDTVSMTTVAGRRIDKDMMWTKLTRVCKPRRCFFFTLVVILTHATLINLVSFVTSKPDKKPDKQPDIGRMSRELAAPNETRSLDVNRDSVDVLITTYMRSGSSFLGRVLGFRRDTFYVYEPLWKLTQYGYLRGEHDRCGIFNPGCSKSNQLPMALNVLRQIYNCSFHKDPAAGSFKDNIQPKLSGPAWQDFRTCPNRYSPNSTCLRQLAEDTCLKTQHRVTKVLRLSVRNTELMLQSNPNLKVVYLVRDPRAVINSHMRTSWSHIHKTNPGSVSTGASAICGRMEEDIAAAVELRAKYPTRFIVVQYEDFLDPLPKVEILYKFLGMGFTSEVMKYIDDSVQTKQASSMEGYDADDMNERQEELGDSKSRDSKNNYPHVDEPNVDNDKNNDIGEMQDNNNLYDDNADDMVDVKFDENYEETDLLGIRTIREVEKTPALDAKSRVKHDGNHPFTYRESLPWVQIQAIDKRCERVYKLLGYRKFSSERVLKDMSVDAVAHPLPFTIG